MAIDQSDIYTARHQLDDNKQTNSTAIAGHNGEIKIRARTEIASTRTERRQGEEAEAGGGGGEERGGGEGNGLNAFLSDHVMIKIITVGW